MFICLLNSPDMCQWWLLVTTSQFLTSWKCQLPTVDVIGYTWTYIYKGDHCKSRIIDIYIYIFIFIYLYLNVYFTEVSSLQIMSSRVVPTLRMKNTYFFPADMLRFGVVPSIAPGHWSFGERWVHQETCSVSWSLWTLVSWSFIGHFFGHQVCFSLVLWGSKSFCMLDRTKKDQG